MKTFVVTILAALGCLLSSASAQKVVAKKPPVGVPMDATFFNGHWFRLYLERTEWRMAKLKCEELGGHLAVVPDEPTHLFIRGMAEDRSLWLGGFKKTEGLWEWVDGSPMKFKGWGPHQPDVGLGFKVFHTWRGGWGDTNDKDPNVVGYICEWKDK